MLFPRTNIEKKLEAVRNKRFKEDSWMVEVQNIFDELDQSHDRIISEIEEGKSSKENNFNFSELETDKIYHIDQIKKICIDYRLRFLNSKYFKGKLPQSAIAAIRDLEATHDTTLQGFKIIAPSKLFKLENADDPLLFAPIGNEYYYLVHKWGNDLHPFRKRMMWFFKSFENLIVLTFLVSLLASFLVPDGLFTKDNSTSNFLMIFFFIFKSTAAIVLFYGFALGKNFNTEIWNSKYFNA